jgi:hypothetical protein
MTHVVSYAYSNLYTKHLFYNYNSNRDAIPFLTPNPKAQWLLYVPPGLVLHNPTHSVFMCFVWFWLHRQSFSVRIFGWLTNGNKLFFVRYELNTKY